MNRFFAIVAALDSQKVLLFAIALGAFYYFTVFDSGETLQTEIETLKGQVRSEEAKKNDTDATLQEEKRMKEAVGILSEQYQIISKKLPTEVSSLEINQAVEAYAKETQVRITGTKPGSAEKMEIVNEVPLDVTLEGRYPDLLQFVYNVSVAERLTKIKNFTITPLSTDEKISQTGLLKFDGTIVGYKLAPEPAENADPTKGPKQ